MTIYGILESDHKTTFANLNRLYEVLTALRCNGTSGAPSRYLGEFKKLTAYFQKEIDGHMREEEKVLFPYLRSHIPRLEPMICLLLSEHDDFRHCLKALKKVLARCRTAEGCRPAVMDTLQERGTYLICLLRSHMWCESHSLYKAADGELRPAEKKELIRKIRSVHRIKNRKKEVCV